MITWTALRSKQVFIVYSSLTSKDGDGKRRQPKLTNQTERPIISLQNPSMPQPFSLVLFYFNCTTTIPSICWVPPFLPAWLTFWTADWMLGGADLSLGVCPAKPPRSDSRLLDMLVCCSFDTSFVLYCIYSPVTLTPKVIYNPQFAYLLSWQLIVNNVTKVNKTNVTPFPHLHISRVIAFMIQSLPNWKLKCIVWRCLLCTLPNRQVSGRCKKTNESLPD